MRRIPSPDAPLDTEALEGERVTVYEISEEGWAWGQLAGDGYVGYLSANALRPVGPAMTHKVVAARTLVFPGPSIKLPPSGGLPFGARLSVARIVEPFAVTTTGACVPLRHLAPDRCSPRAIMSRSPSFSCTRPISGAARRRTASTARRWCRWR